MGKQEAASGCLAGKFRPSMGCPPHLVLSALSADLGWQAAHSVCKSPGSVPTCAQTVSDTSHHSRLNFCPMGYSHAVQSSTFNESSLAQITISWNTCNGCIIIIMPCTNHKSAWFEEEARCRRHGQQYIDTACVQCKHQAALTSSLFRREMPWGKAVMP